jgi:hypothetical protein
MKIQAWHGKMTADKQNNATEKIRILDKIARKCHEGFEWEFTGTLDEFTKQYPHHFMALYAGGEHVIYVTQFSNFGQR